MELFNDTRPHFERGRDWKTEDNMAPHKLLRVGEAQRLLSRDGEMAFILEHQLILLRSPLLDPSEQIFHISCAAGATPCTIWAEAQTHTPGCYKGKAKGEKGYSSSMMITEMN